MSFYRSVILSGLMLFFSFCCGAQNEKYVYKDSAIFYNDSLEAAKETRKDKEEISRDENDSGETESEFIRDTILRNNELFVESDSIRALKNSKPFAYTKNLDTLLYKYQQSLEKDQASAGKEITWIARFLFSPVTKYFFWLLAGVFVSFILYKLFFTEGFFQRSYARINEPGMPDEKENLSKSADYGKLVALAVSNRNYRLAVRYHFLQSLQKLSSKGAIQFAPDKTNYQYIRELSGKTYKNAFASLTLNYEYIWYGEFEIDENIFLSVQNKFKQFNSEI